MGIKMKLRGLFATAILALSAAMPSQGYAITNGVYLALDSSGSIDAADWTLQVNGTVGALNTVFGTNNYWGTAIGVSHFSNTVVEIASMTIINDATDLLALTTAISGTVQIGSTTALGAAIDAAAAAILAFEGVNGAITNKVIDVSTDGVNNVGGDPVTAANAALASGIKTNCLGVLNFGANAPDCSFATGPIAIFADSFADYQDALTGKLIAELTVPEPGITALLGMGLLGIGFARRKQS